MLRRMTLAAAAFALAAPALAEETCLEDRIGAQCDVFLEEYRTDDVPVGTSMMWSQDEFLLEDWEEIPPGAFDEWPAGEDVLYWDGETAMIVPERAGPQVKIADW